MNDTNFRLIFNGMAPNANPKKLLIFFQKNLGLPNGEIQKFMTSPPRVVREFSALYSASAILSSITKLGGLAFIEPVILYPSVPFAISQKQDNTIRKELSKVLRCRSSLLLLYLQIGTEDPKFQLPSMMGPFGEEIHEYFRESDTVIPIDDTRVMVIAFATDKLGIAPLQNKVQRVFKKMLQEARIMQSGYAVFPDEGHTLEKLLQVAVCRRDERTAKEVNKGLESADETPLSPSEPGAEDQTSADLFLTCFRDAKGRVFKRLLNMDPQTLWAGLCAVPESVQKDFVFRLPFDAPLASILEELINSPPNCLTDKLIENHFKAIIIQMKLAQDSMERRQMLDEVQYKLHHSNDLPTLPAVATQIFQIAADQLTSGKELSDIIMRDPALTSKLLKTVNSAFYGHAQKISSVPQAIFLLGNDDIIDIAFGLAAAKIFDIKSFRGIADPNHLWHHAICTALIAQDLCRKIPEYEDLVFAAGLLHDVGKIFLIEKFTDLCIKAYSHNEDYNLPLFELEEDIFGTNHAIIGKELALRWNLPEALVHAIAYHHQPSSAPSHSGIAAIIGLADYLYYKAAKPETLPPDRPTLTHWLTAGHWIILNRFFDGMNLIRLQEMEQTAVILMEKNQDHLKLPM